MNTVVPSQVSFRVIVFGRIPNGITSDGDPIWVLSGGLTAQNCDMCEFESFQLDSWPTDKEACGAGACEIQPISSSELGLDLHFCKLVSPIKCNEDTI